MAGVRTVTDNAELKQAATALVDALWKVQDWNTTHVGDCIEAVESALQKPADDGEPLTEEWLASVGAEFSETAYTRHWQLEYICFFFWKPEACESEPMHVELMGGYQFPCRTRGDVRRLCAALGIELKEPS